LSADEDDKKNDQSDHQSKQNEPGSHPPKQNYSNNSSDHQGDRLGMDNKGMQLLLKMGWIQGNGLGVGQKGKSITILIPISKIQFKEEKKMI
jgi:hypothetical protein